jgi:hypothetical protein
MRSALTLIKSAYTITTGRPSLWFFGLFLVGAVNPLLLHALGLQGRWPELLSINYALPFFGWPFLLSAPIVALIVFGMFVAITNIARIWLLAKVLLHLRDYSKRFSNLEGVAELVSELVLWPEQTKPQSIVRAKFWPTFWVSIFTNIYYLVALLAIALPAIVLKGTEYAANQFIVVAIILFLPLAIFGMYLNIFTPFFIICFNQSLAKSLIQTWDLLVSRWRQILLFFIFIFGFYALSLFVISGLLETFHLSLASILEFFVDSSILPANFSQLLSNFGATIIGWFLLAILNVFFHVSMLLLFIYLVRPMSLGQVTQRVFQHTEG